MEGLLIAGHGSENTFGWSCLQAVVDIFWRTGTRHSLEQRIDHGRILSPLRKYAGLREQQRFILMHQQISPKIKLANILC